MKQAVKDLQPIYGNPTLTSLDGQERATLQTILSPSWDALRQAEFGVYLVDTEVPEGMVWDGGFIKANGLPVANFRNPTSEEMQGQQDQIKAEVKLERDRRLEADFEFQGKMFQRDTKSLQRITGAGTLAGLYIGNGGDPTSLKWHATAEAPNPDDFAWIASDDTLVPMDAATVFAFSREAAAVETRLIFAAKTLRSMDPIPDDFTDDKWWP